MTPQEHREIDEIIKRDFGSTWDLAIWPSGWDRDTGEYAAIDQANPIQTYPTLVVIRDGKAEVPYDAK